MVSTLRAASTEPLLTPRLCPFLLPSPTGRPAAEAWLLLDAPFVGENSVRRHRRGDGAGRALAVRGGARPSCVETSGAAVALRPPSATHGCSDREPQRPRDERHVSEGGVWKALRVSTSFRPERRRPSRETRREALLHGVPGEENSRLTAHARRSSHGWPRPSSRPRRPGWLPGREHRPGSDRLGRRPRLRPGQAACLV